MKKRLELVGCRSVNNIVDATNYLLFALGEPLHVFDIAKLAASRKPQAASEGLEINIRRARTGEKIITIDGEEKMLGPEILVIADGQKPVAVAGVMGGRDSAVSENTKDILLEAAVFNPLSVRRSKQALGLASESAYRFERGVDAALVETASSAALGLIQKLAGGALSCAKSAGSIRQKHIYISFAAQDAQRILGKKIAPAKMKTILSSLGFEVKPKGKNNFLIGVPSRRADARLDVDLIEEAARLYGFSAIPETLPPVAPQPSPRQPRDLVSTLKNTLAGLGLNEVITYSLVDREMGQLCGKNEAAQAVRILNPLSREQEILRPSLIPSLIKCAAYNINQKQAYINIFEIASTFYQSGERPGEELSLAIALCGARSRITESGLSKEAAGALDLKGILETVFERMGAADYCFVPHGGQAADIVVQGRKIGILLKASRQALEQMGIKNQDLFALEISLEKMFAYLKPRKAFCSLPKYPGISRDISFVLKEGVALKEVLDALRAQARPLLAETQLTDYYKGRQIPDGFRGLTVSCLYRSPERTLTEEEVNPLHAQALTLLTERFGAKIR